jgi:hypothetical protein
VGSRPTPEEILEHIDEISAREGYIVPADAVGSMAFLAPHLSLSF